MATRKPIFRATRIRPGAGGRSPLGRSGVVKIRRDYAEDWEALRLKVFERDGWKCRRCPASLRGTNRRHVHHIKPLSKGGTNHMSNLISLCDCCHDQQHEHMRKSTIRRSR